MFLTALKEVEVFLFDMDGVLLDSSEGGIRIVETLFKNIYGQEMDAQKKNYLQQIWGHPGQEIMRRIFPDKSAEELRTAWEKVDSNPPKLFPYALNILQLLKKDGLLIGIATNRSLHSLIETCSEVLKEIDLLLTFSSSRSLEENRALLSPVRNDLPLFINNKGKPHPRFLTETLRYLRTNYGIPRKKVGFLGDTIADLQTASAAGIGFFGIVTSGQVTKEQWPSINLPPANTFSSITDFYFRLKEE